MKTLYPLINLLCITLCLSCVNIKHVNSLSQGAVKTLETYDEIDYTYTNGYYKYVLPVNDYRYNKEEYASTKRLNLPDRSIEVNEPETSIKADNAISFFVSGLQSYFKSLGDLSDKDLINYDYEGIAKNLKADSKLKLKLGNITDSQIDASSKISKILTDEITKSYRANKIRNIIISHNTDVSDVIGALIQILSGPRLKAIQIDRELIKTKYFVILTDSRLDLGTKILLREKYVNEVAELDKNEPQIKTLIEALNEIKIEHNKLAALLQTQKIDSQQVKDTIYHYRGIIESLLENIKKLKK